ncbi:MAG TPA: amylo-alpha-1,6-glucosidase [Holophagaceae bacterium]|nr:amylo-alpha-1,6-glucosidase [Holophagaceae bacterium]
MGDRLQVELRHPDPGRAGWSAFLRTNLTRGSRAREELVALAGAEPGEPRTFAGASWRDIPMREGPEGWLLDLPLTEVGPFRAKAYAVDPEGRQHWPEGGDLGLSVHPDGLRAGNILYCAFPRLFGHAPRPDPVREAAVAALDREGWTVIPPSGTLRDLAARVPHIMDGLGCRILHLLPLAPTPTTYARFGRFGSPYATLDLTAIDPALVCFDRRSTAEDQFIELADAVHGRGGLVLLDLVAHHSGWGSRLMDEHPDWFRRDGEGRFLNPGAWGVVWGDLVEVDDHHPAYWKELAEALLVWCRRGVDGFRCDAGYMVPLAAWQYLQARVRQVFPDTVFLLEGLGGAWELTESLLGEGGMQWAYSELFQNYDGGQVSGYLDHALRQVGRLGPLVHYSETHDNRRLAERGAAWALMRHRLCALCSDSGAFGFTCGSEWLATEKIDVHHHTDLAWGHEPNLVEPLRRLNQLLRDHPCFFDGATLRRLSPPGSPALALERVSREGLDRCLVLVNLDPQRSNELVFEGDGADLLATCRVELLGQAPPQARPTGDGATRLAVALEPGAAFCLSRDPEPRGLAGQAYRDLRCASGWALQQMAAVLAPEDLGPCAWQELGAWVREDPGRFLGCLASLDPVRLRADLLGSLRDAAASERYPPLRLWETSDLSRVLPLPPDHWLLFRDGTPFRVSLRGPGMDWQAQSVPSAQGQVAALPPQPVGLPWEAELEFHRLEGRGQRLRGRILFLPAEAPPAEPSTQGLLLLANGRGAMVRLQADLGRVASKYDCLLGANLDPQAPCDRLVLAKRARVWVNADGFLTPLDGGTVVSVAPGPPARWTFMANAGDGRQVPLALEAAMVPGRNTVVLRFHREPGPGASAQVRLTVRLDLEHRSFHEETSTSPELDRRFVEGTRLLNDREGFRFDPYASHPLRAWTREGRYHPEPEWCVGLEHPIEGQRGLRDRGDAWSPGWFELPLAPGGTAALTLTAEAEDSPEPTPPAPAGVEFEDRLRNALTDFVARRGEGLTVVAGYPWFLDWGRDSAIVARGLAAGGMVGKARGVLLTLAAEVREGSLLNRLGTGDRDTSDAPLWFALACEETAAALGPAFHDTQVAPGRSLRETLLDLGRCHLSGTTSGVWMDPASALLWSPARHTWMDTAHPMGTPREGYPIELQALWIRLLRQLGELDAPEGRGGWKDLEARAIRSLERYWMEEEGRCADTLEAARGVGAESAVLDRRCRPNQLLLVTLGLLRGPRARRMVDAVSRQLLVPGALRSLSPWPVDLSGLRQGLHPYAGRYEGDEDTRRKPAYHNGTAWVWWLPIYAEALALAWESDGRARAAGRAHLAGLGALLDSGCLGQLPELLDGDAPHAPRGCDAQAWSVSEALRVWCWMERCRTAEPLQSTM